MPIVLVPLVGFALLLAWLVLFGMHRSINDWLVPFLTSLLHPHGSILTRVAMKPISLAAGGILWIVNQVDHAVTKAASHGSAAVAHWFHGLAAWITHVASGAEAFAEDVAFGLEQVVGHTVPREIEKATQPLWRTVRANRKYLLGLLVPEILLGKWLYGQLRHHVLPRLKYLYHQTTVVLPRAIAREGARVGRVETQLSKPTRAFLRRYARLLWAAGLFGLVIRTLARKFPWLFCRNTKTFGNNLCRINTNLLGSLFADAIILGGTYSLVQFATEVVKVTAQVENAMIDLFRELEKVEQDYLGPNRAETVGLATVLGGGFHDYLGPITRGQ